MADKKISALTAASTPLAGTEVLPIVQSGSTVKVSVDNLTTGKVVSASGVAIAPASFKNWNVVKAMQVGTAASFGGGDGFADGFATCNSYYDGSNWRRIAAAGASQVALTPSTGLRFNIAGSGAADSTMTWTEVGSFSALADFTVNSGNIVIGTAGKGIDFSANTHAAGMTSELLNDYEEGTWTATISDGTTDATMNAGRRTGTYTKVGRQVTVTLYVATTSMTGVTGNLRIKGLPFTAGNNDVGGGAVGYCDSSMTFLLGQTMTLQTQNGADYIVIRYWNGASGTVNMTGSQWGAAGEIGFTLTYFV